MFHVRERVVDQGTGRCVEYAFTDARPSAEPERLTLAFGGARVVTMQQVHGSAVTLVRSSDELVPTCDALITDTPETALCARTADCVPVLLHDGAAGVVGAVHAGRRGLAAGVVPAAVDAMRDLGARDITAVIGPHICGGCYEVPDRMRAEVAAAVPASFACTTWGTPSLDIGAGVRAQLADGACAAIDRSQCTMHADGFHSFRRDGARAGRMAAVIVWHEP